MEMLNLIDKARDGDRGSLDTLVRAVQERLRTYIYRSTLCGHLTEDLLQETLIEMAGSIKNLRNSESFWPWVFRICSNKIRVHYRQQKRAAKISGSSSALDDFAEAEGIDSSEIASDRELAEKVAGAVKNLSYKYRQAISLRCFEQMEYSQIAEAMDCSNIDARVLFHRAKKSLKRQLVRSGLGKGAVLPAICLFGRFTSRSKAAGYSAGAVSASMDAGPMAAVIGTVGTLPGIIAALTAFNSKNHSSDAAGLPGRGQVKSFHYVEQSWDGASALYSNLLRGRSLSKGAYEQWFFFPEGVDGPMFMMMQRWDPQQESKLCGWLQNEDGNYYYHSGEQKYYVRNYRLPMRTLRVRRLPSDTEEFISFLDSVEGKIEGINYTRDSKTGLLTGVLDERFYNAPHFQSKLAYNDFNEKQFNSFRHKWPEDLPGVDLRDRMHQRGWTYFKITGHIGGKAIAGKGMMPFVYGIYKSRKPWFELTAGEDIYVFDRAGAAGVRYGGGDRDIFAGGSLFRPFARPWMGMHCIDLIRREAVKEKIVFKTITQEVADGEDEKAVVKFFVSAGGEGGEKMIISYDVNVDRDIVESIEIGIERDGGVENAGRIFFDYLDEVEGLDLEFSEPIAEPGASQSGAADMFWFVELID